MRISWTSFGPASACKTRGRGSCDRDVLIDAATARSDCADHHTVALDGNSAAEDHDLGIMWRVEPEAHLARLRDPRQIIGRHIEGACGPRFVDCDVDAPEPRTVHPHLCHHASPRIA